MNICQILIDLVEILITGGAGISRRIAIMGTPTPTGAHPTVQALQTYWQALQRLALVAILGPIPILIIGMIGGWGWLVALVGIFWAVCTLGLLIVATPIGLLIDELLNQKGVGGGYVRFALGIFLVELTFMLFVAVVPIQNNLAALPLVVVAAAILGILAASGPKTAFTKKLIGGIATILLVIFTLSFFFPMSFKAMGKAGEKIDEKVAANLRCVENSALPECQPTSALQPQATEAKTIVWTLDQTIEALPDKWVEIPIKPDGKTHKFVPEVKGRIEFLADGRHGQTDAFGQADFGEIRNSLKIRGIGGKVTVFLYTGA